MPAGDRPAHVQPGQARAFNFCLFPRNSAASAAAPSTCTASAKRWRGSIWASPPPCWPRFWAAIPITVGATPEQKKLWLTRIAEEGLLFAYGATEPDAGSDLGALQTTAERVMEDEQVVGYKINGSKQWISNGGIADAYTILANTPAGPSWFVVEKGAPGFHPRQAGRQARHPPQQHGGALAQRRLCRCRPADRRRGRPGTDPGASGVRLHAPDGGGVRPGRRMGRAGPRHSVFHQAHPGRSAALGKAGIHAQADRAERGCASKPAAPTSRKPPSASTPAKAV